MAFSWAIPMAFSAQAGVLPLTAWLTFAAAVSMTVAYDTYYAMVDRDDDVLIGVKSTAVLFGDWDRTIIALLQALTLALLLWVGQIENLGLFFYLGLAIMATLFAYQYVITKQREREACFKAFLNNHLASLAVWVGLVLDYL